MTKRINLAKITSFVLLLTVTAMILVAGTYAKYSSEASGTDATVVAKWSFKVNGTEIAVKGSAPTVDFNLFETINDTDGKVETDVADGLIAPGTAGSFEFVLNNSSEVTTKYNINLEVTEGSNVPLQFSVDGGQNWTNVENLSDLVATDVMGIGTTKNVTVQWQWAFDGNTDAALGGEKVKVTANITATQVDSGEYSDGYTEKQIFPGVTTIVNNYDFTELDLSSNSAAPFAYQNTDLFSGKTITKIGIPVGQVQTIDENQTFTLHIVDKTTLVDDGKATIKSSMTLKLPIEQLEGSDPTAVNKYVYIDLTPYNITLAEDETLGFMSSTDTVLMLYAYNKDAYFIGNDYKVATRINSKVNYLTGATNFYLDIYYLEKETTEQPETLSSILANKNFSILGDSISTYSGYSNDATNTNDTIGNNDVYYNGSKASITSVEQTWWKQAINETGMNLLVNNSWSGSQIANDLSTSGSAGYLRATNLHDNTGDNSGTTPDIVALWMGINDIYAGTELGTYSTDLYNTLITNDGSSYTYATPTTFTEAYIITVHKIINTYENVDLFCFTLLPTDWVDRDLIEPYNEVIRNVATYYNVEIVDLFNDSGITWDNYTNYYDDTNELHPNPTGMDMVTQTFINALENKYLNNN